MVDFDELAEVGLAAGEGHGAARGGVKGRARRRGKVQPGVKGSAPREGVVAVAEGGHQLGGIQRQPRWQAHRHQVVQRGRVADALDLLLQACQTGLQRAQGIRLRSRWQHRPAPVGALAALWHDGRHGLRCSALQQTDALAQLAGLALQPEQAPGQRAELLEREGLRRGRIGVRRPRRRDTLRHPGTQASAGREQGECAGSHGAKQRAQRQRADPR